MDYVEYKLIYRAYGHSQLIGKQTIYRDEEESDKTQTKSVSEAKDWSDTLNASAEEGFTIRESGVLPKADNLVFWALLERP